MFIRLSLFLLGKEMRDDLTSQSFMAVTLKAIDRHSTKVHSRGHRRRTGKRRGEERKAKARKGNPPSPQNPSVGRRNPPEIPALTIRLVSSPELHRRRHLPLTSNREVVRLCADLRERSRFLFCFFPRRLFFSPFLSFLSFVFRFGSSRCIVIVDGPERSKERLVSVSLRDLVAARSAAVHLLVDQN